MRIFIVLLFLPLFLMANPTKKILILGDSLSEGYGVSKESSYPVLLQKILNDKKKGWEIVNSSVSGSTSASATGRLKWLLKTKFDILILALGANDGLRGLNPKDMDKNLSQAIEMAQKENIKVVLFGMKMPPNYGGKYTKEFEKTFLGLAKKYNSEKHSLTFVPFFLEGVAGNKDLNQSDGIHPNEKGHAVLSQNVFKGIEKLL